MPAPEFDAPTFARAFVSFLTWVHDADSAGRNPLTAGLTEHLGEAATETSVVAREFTVFQQVNLQVALDVWTCAPGRRVDVLGLTLPPHHGSPDLAQLLGGHGLPHVRAATPDLVDLPSGPGRTTAVWRAAVLLVTDERGRYALMVRGPERHMEPTLVLEVAGLPTATAQQVLAEVEALRDQHDVHRGQVLELSATPQGMAVSFPVLPRTDRDDVVLPDAVLARVERHSIGIAARRAELRAAGQHLKRGLLLYGPPGTGKTHTTRYVVQHLPGATVLLLSGRSLHMVGAVTQLARDLQPSVVVLEDVDLVAEDRGLGDGPQPVLFELLDSMDGAASDADLLFLLTTNRADLLEPALAARPGRVDVAIEIGLPGEDARRRLLQVYARGLDLQVEAAEVDAVITRTAGVTASFIKELVRRAVLESLLGPDSGPLTDPAPDPGTGPVARPVTGADLRRALDDLLDSSQGLTRALLGVPGAA